MATFVSERKGPDKNLTLATMRVSLFSLSSSRPSYSLSFSLVRRVYANARRMSPPFTFRILSPSKDREKGRERNGILCLRTLCRRLRKMPVGVFVRLKSPQWDGCVQLHPVHGFACLFPREPPDVPLLAVAIDCPSTPR